MGNDLPGTLWAWQEEVKDRCTAAAADDRMVNYIIDKKGGTGKSKFCKYMCYKHKALMVPWGRTGDILNLVVKKGAEDNNLFENATPLPNSISGTADFVNSLNNFHLQSTSDAIDQGSTLPYYTFDKDKKGVTTVPEVGAFEYIPSP